MNDPRKFNIVPDNRGAWLIVDERYEPLLGDYPTPQAAEAVIEGWIREDDLAKAQEYDDHERPRIEWEDM